MKQVRCNGEDDGELRIGGQGAIKSTDKNDYSPAASK